MNEVETILKYRILIPEVPVKMHEVAIATQDFKKSALNNEHGSCYRHRNPLHTMESLRKLRLLGDIHPAAPSPRARHIFPFVTE